MSNHLSGHKAGVAGIYNKGVYDAEKRAALEAWAAALDGASGSNLLNTLSALRLKKLQDPQDLPSE